MMSVGERDEILVMFKNRERVLYSDLNKGEVCRCCDVNLEMFSLYFIVM